MAVFGSETVDKFMADGHPVDSWFVLLLFHRCSRLLGDNLSRGIRFRRVILRNIGKAGSGDQHHGQRIGDGEHAGNKADGNSDGENDKVHLGRGADEQQQQRVAFDGYRKERIERGDSQAYSHGEDQRVGQMEHEDDDGQQTCGKVLALLRAGQILGGQP